ncbi:hypothetical protein [Speluncibacter jeojiensis]|uniref:Uncharacterized protein n=1 Tax=Speluncibacter jeojiensis TaxID=2710754 RepID=A0A9X4M4J9_9ACTN|nr:hypothetical protein [Corynebacteriales bacterium D3-21]
MSDPLNSPASAFGKSPDGCPSLSLTLWADAWLRGSAAPDDVIDAMAPWAPMHLVTAADEASARATGTPWPAVEDQAVPTLLRILRESRGRTRAGVAHLTLALPVPGDVRGLPVGSALAREATAAGEALVVHTGTDHTLPGPAGIVGIVPVVEGPDVLRWVVHVQGGDVTALPTTAAPLGEAEYAMRTAVRDAAETLTRLGTPEPSDATGDPRTVVADLMARAGVHRYPDDLPERALRVLDSAAHVAAILTVAGGNATGGHPGAPQREQALRPLWDSVRDARLSAVAAGLQQPGTGGYGAAS